MGDICPAGATIAPNFPAPGAEYRYLEGQPALDFFDAQIFSALVAPTCWHNAATQVLFRYNAEGFNRFFRYDGFETFFGEVGVWSAGCVSTTGQPGSYVPAALVSLLGDGLEFIALFPGGQAFDYVQSTPDGSGVFDLIFQAEQVSCY